jgi:hypothetical protein
MATPAWPAHFRRRLATAALVGCVGGGWPAATAWILYPKRG